MSVISLPLQILTLKGGNALLCLDIHDMDKCLYHIDLHFQEENISIFSFWKKSR